MFIAILKVLWTFCFVLLCGKKCTDNEECSFTCNAFYIDLLKSVNLCFKGLQKGNRSYLVEYLISRKAMMILLQSLVIQLALLFHCWDMYIGKNESNDQKIVSSTIMLCSLKKPMLICLYQIVLSWVVTQSYSSMTMLTL